MRAHPTPHPSRTGRRLAGAALTAAVTGLAATPAVAADAGTVEVAPSPVRAGTTVTLSTVACGTGGSAGVDASSLGGGIVGLAPQDAESGTAAGTLRVPDGTEPGNYAVDGSCTDGRKLAGTVVVSTAQRTPEHTDGQGKGKQAPGQPAKGRADGRDSEGDHRRGKGADRGRQDHPQGDHQAPGHHGQDPHHVKDGPHEQDHRQDAHHQRDPRHDGDARHDRGEGRHGAMPHGRVHTGLGGGTEGVDSVQLAGGSAALTAAAGGVLYLRRRGRRPGH